MSSNLSILYVFINSISYGVIHRDFLGFSQLDVAVSTIMSIFRYYNYV